jgi:hypothetical protein
MKMKHFNKVVAAVIILLGTASAKAQSTASATATATIVSPITISQTADMSFGNVAIDAVTDGTVILDVNGNRTPTGGVTLPAVAGTVSAASFTVTGNSGFTYAITLPTDITLVHSLGLASMLADNVVSTPSGVGTLTGGSEVINVGATLNVTGGQQSGFYSGSFDVTVNYN